MGLKPSSLDPSSFSAVTLLVGSFIVPNMTYNVFGGTLNLAQLNSSFGPYDYYRRHDYSRLLCMSVNELNIGAHRPLSSEPYMYVV